MKASDQLHAKLKSGYFDLISEINQDTCENLWTGMMRKLKSAVHASYAVIYLYEPSLQTYQLKSRLEEEAVSLHETITEADLQKLALSKDEKNISFILKMFTKKKPLSILLLKKHMMLKRCN